MRSWPRSVLFCMERALVSALSTPGSHPRGRGPPSTNLLLPSRKKRSTWEQWLLSVTQLVESSHLLWSPRRAYLSTAQPSIRITKNCRIHRTKWKRRVPSPSLECTRLYPWLWRVEKLTTDAGTCEPSGSIPRYERAHGRPCVCWTACPPAHLPMGRRTQRRPLFGSPWHIITGRERADGVDRLAGISTRCSKWWCISSMHQRPWAMLTQQPRQIGPLMAQSSQESGWRRGGEWRRQDGAKSQSLTT